MKRFLKNISFVLALLAFVACEKDYEILSENTFAQLDGASEIVIDENGGTSTSINVLLGSPQSTDVTISFDIDGDASRYSVSSNSVVISAGDTSGSISLSPIDDDEINGDEVLTVSLSPNSDLPVGIRGDGISFVSKTITIIDDNVPCNDYIITVNTDNWSNESHWYLIDDNTGERILEVGGLTQDDVDTQFVNEITLADGCYTFRIWDEYGDGLSGTPEGNYEIRCGSRIAGSGAGAFDDVGVPGATAADLPTGWTFQQAPTADLVGFVEEVKFCVNQ